MSVVCAPVERFLAGKLSEFVKASKETVDGWKDCRKFQKCGTHKKPEPTQFPHGEGYEAKQ